MQKEGGNEEEEASLDAKGTHTSTPEAHCAPPRDEQAKWTGRSFPGTSFTLDLPPSTVRLK